MPESYAVKGNLVYNGQPNVPTDVVRGINNILTSEMVKLGHARSSQVEFPITVKSDLHSEGKPSEFHITKGEYGQLYAVHSTANNPKRWKVPLADVAMHGDFSPQFDDIQSYGGWLKAANIGANEFAVDLPRKTGFSIIEAFSDVPAKFDPRDTPLPKYVKKVFYEGPINKIGPAFHETGNLRDSITKYVGSRVGKDLGDYLKSKGQAPEEFGWLGINVGMPKGAIYGVGRAKDGKVIIIAASKVYEINASEATALGIKAEEFRNYALTEEEIHTARKSYDRVAKGVNRIKEEIATKSDARAFYLRMAEISAGNPKLQRMYKRLAEIAESDIATTPKRYKEGSIFTRGSLDDIVNNSNVEVVADKGGKVYTLVDGKRVVGGDGAYTPTKFVGSGKEYDGKPREPRESSGKIGPNEIRSMSDAQVVASKELQDERQEAPESAES